jgi:hypothetical protein
MILAFSEQTLAERAAWGECSILKAMWRSPPAHRLIRNVLSSIDRLYGEEPSFVGFRYHQPASRESISPAHPVHCMMRTLLNG